MLPGLVHLTEAEDDCEQRKTWKRDLCHRSASVLLPNRSACIIWTIVVVFYSFYVLIGSFFQVHSCLKDCCIIDRVYCKESHQFLNLGNDDLKSYNTAELMF